MLALTRNQVREIDRRSIQEYGLPGIVLMENAALAVVDVAMEMLAGQAEPTVLIVCGGGNNGGDGLAVARHLHNRGVRVEILAAFDDLAGDAAVQWRVVRAMELPVVRAEDADIPLMGKADDLAIDALFGTGLSRPIAGTAAGLVEMMNASGRPVLAVDLPSGLDCDTGEPLGTACVRATRTVTFVAEKAGFANPKSREFTGPVTVGEIGCPRELIEAVAGETR